MKRPVYIREASAIGPQPVFDTDRLERVEAYTGHPLRSIVPALRRYVDPVRGRRMEKVARIGLGAALNALDRAGGALPEAIIVGTGLGCMESTERFFVPLLHNNEDVPNPTAFIQSTHNNVAGQIALATNCTGYNFTYLHRGISFTSALLDGWMQVGLEGRGTVLVGGAESITPDYYTVQRRSGIWKQHDVPNLEVLKATDGGALCGEGAAFFVLGDGPGPGPAVRVVDVDISFRGGPGSLRDRVHAFLDRHGLSADAIDLLMIGRNGDGPQDTAYAPVETDLPLATHAAFKHLCGEFHTANAFGLWLLWSGLRTGHLPGEAVLHRGARSNMRWGLLVDHFQRKDHSLVLLERCGPEHPDAQALPSGCADQLR